MMAAFDDPIPARTIVARITVGIARNASTIRIRPSSSPPPG